jgi:hypothetical protein
MDCGEVDKRKLRLFGHIAPRALRGGGTLPYVPNTV